MIVLYVKPHCLYCEASKNILSEFNEIKIHDLINEGVPDGLDSIAPRLCVYDTSGKLVGKLDGLQNPNTYLRFLIKHKEFLN